MYIDGARDIARSPHYATFHNKFITAEKYKTAGIAGTATETQAQKSQAHFTQWTQTTGSRKSTTIQKDSYTLLHGTSPNAERFSEPFH